MPLSRAFLKTLNPGSMKPGVDYAVFLLKPSGTPHAVVDVEIVDKSAVAIYTSTCTNGLDTVPFENTTRAVKGFFKEIGLLTHGSYCLNAWVGAPERGFSLFG